MAATGLDMEIFEARYTRESALLLWLAFMLGLPTCQSEPAPAAVGRLVVNLRLERRRHVEQRLDAARE